VRSAARGAGLLCLSVLVPACDKGESAPVTARSEQVIATGTIPTSAPEASAPQHATSPPRNKKLCDGDGNAKGRQLSKTSLAHVEAAGAPRLDGALPASRGAWTWINFWAAWCGPCKEEMPRLLAWQDKLGKAGSPVHLVFVSLDDDKRQLEQFLEQQPADGLKGSLWLPDGPARANWLAALRMKSAPELPEQALVDPTGRVRCFIEGAVDEGDYAEIAGLVSH
jgi:thiol-disulfide isomerase/thioredoxin